MKPATSLCFWRTSVGTSRCTSASPPSAARLTAQTTRTPYTTLIIRESSPFGQARRRPPPYKPGGGRANRLQRKPGDRTYRASAELGRPDASSGGYRGIHNPEYRECLYVYAVG